FPTYTEIAAAARDFLAEAGQHERQVMAFLVDIPLCTTTALPDFNRGYVEDYVHFEPPPEAARGLLSDEVLAARRGGDDGELIQIRRGDLDESARSKRPECRECRYDR